MYTIYNISINAKKTTTKIYNRYNSRGVLVGGQLYRTINIVRLFTVCFLLKIICKWTDDDH